MNRVRNFITRDKKSLLTFGLACFASMLSSVSANILTSLLLGLLDTSDHRVFQPRVYIALVLVVVPSLMLKISGELRISFIKKKMLELRNLMFNGLIHLNSESFNKKSKDEYLSYLTNDLNTFRNDYFTALEGFIVKFGLIVIGLLFVLFMDIKFFFMLLIYALILGLFSGIFRKKMVVLNKDISNLNSEYSVQLANLFSGIDIIKANDAEDIFLTNAEDVYQRQEKKKASHSLVNGIQNNLMSRIGTLSSVLVLLYVSYRISTGDMFFSEAVFIIFFVKMITQSISEIFPDINNMKASEGMLNIRLEHLVSASNGVESTESTSITLKEKADFSFNDKIEVNNLKFAYAKKPVLKDVNFSIKKGNKYLVKGESGSGKSTLLNILLGFLTSYEGQITVDGTDLREISQSDFYDKIGIVAQDVFLFEGTLRENICLFKDYSDQDVERAVRLANLEGFVEAQPNGLNTPIVDNGKDISGGEKQRIAIARAVIKRPAIIFTDEMTSSLPSDTAVEIERALLSLDTTIISISHRIYAETVDMYDEVLQIRDRKVASL